jgi:DNA-binding NtrC family response regulator
MRNENVKVYALTENDSGERAFIGVNCAAIPASLIASELFGHEKGAFTGATQRRLGRFESANGGTIFLDDIGDLPPEIQIALLLDFLSHPSDNSVCAGPQEKAPVRWRLKGVERAL